MIYQWKLDALYKNVSAQDVGELLEGFANEGGFISPRRIVVEARPETSILHPMFEWNDEQAAERYRYEQARTLLRSLVTVHVEGCKEPEEPIRAFVNITGKSERGYKQISAVINTPTDHRYLLDCAANDMEAFRRKYTVLTSLSGNISERITPVITAISDFLQDEEKHDED